jgi:hypothetical protein
VKKYRRFVATHTFEQPDREVNKICPAEAQHLSYTHFSPTRKKVNFFRLLRASPAVGFSTHTLVQPEKEVQKKLSCRASSYTSFQSNQKNRSIFAPAAGFTCGGLFYGHFSPTRKRGPKKFVLLSIFLHTLLSNQIKRSKKIWLFYTHFSPTRKRGPIFFCPAEHLPTPLSSPTWKRGQFFSPAVGFTCSGLFYSHFSPTW